MAYKRSVVTFVDILGFADLVHKGSEDDVVEKLDAIADTAARPIGPDGKRTTALVFSDSVIRARPLDGGSLYGALLAEIQDLAASQWDLLAFGMLIRGGTTVGNVSVSGGRAYGRAFVQAYRLESKLAGSPRIVIDPAVIESIRADLRAAAATGGKDELIRGLRDHIRQGDDGVWYVDYVNSVSIVNGPDFLREGLPTIREFIIAEATKFAEVPLILPKYLWLVRYHNQSVHRLLPDVPGLKITARDVPASDEFLKPKRPRAQR